MLRLTLVFVALLALAMGGIIPEMKDKKMADKEHLIKQKQILQVLVHIQEPLMFPQLAEIAKTYKIEDHKEMYTDKNAVNKFIWMWEKQVFLKRGEVFTPYDDEHIRQAVLLFDLFYFAKDWDTMYHTALWAREHLNEGLFAYSWMVALRHYPATKEIVLPPLYEIVPHMFVRSEVMKTAYETRSMNLEKSDKDTVILAHNFSDWMHHDMHPEMRLAYFTEDMALNEWNWEMHMQRPWWMAANVKRYPDMKQEYKGELMYFKQKQLLARYRLERLSNNLEDLKKFKWNNEDLTGYVPHLHYRNGKEMPMRPDNLKVHDIKGLAMDDVKMTEQHILEMVMAMNSAEENGRSGEDLEKSYDNLYGLIDQSKEGENALAKFPALHRKLITLVGKMMDPMNKYNMAPSALMHWETQLRDPAYYSILDKVHDMYRKLMTLKKYPWDKLKLDDVEIESLDIDRLVTYFENFDMELNNGIGVRSLEADKKMTLVARHSRINHKPFNVRAVINSKIAQPVMVRFFLGPKRDMNGLEWNFQDKNEYMVELDRFKMDLTTGKNTLERNSKDFSLFEEDKLNFRNLYKKTEDALQDKSPFYIEKDMIDVKYPEHLLLPKGKKNGMPYSIFMMVEKLEVEEKESAKTPIYRNKSFYTFPFNFEFHKEAFMSKNLMEKEVLIYHKKTDEMHETI